MSMPRLRDVRASLPSTLHVEWADGSLSTIDLASWLEGAGPILAPLRSPEVFVTARVAHHGAAIEWAEDDDLAIDAFHLAMLAGLR